MNGQSNAAKAVSTCGIWGSVACILTFGIFRLNANGDVVVFLVMFCLPVLIVGGAVLGTFAVWAGTWPGRFGDASKTTPGNVSNPTPPFIK